MGNYIKKRVSNKSALNIFKKNIGTSNAQLPALPELPPTESIGDIDNIEKKRYS